MALYLSTHNQWTANHPESPVFLFPLLAIEGFLDSTKKVRFQVHKSPGSVEGHRIQITIFPIDFQYNLQYHVQP